jgi:RNA polymerase sigma-70 factor (ECF subfamily)
LRNNETDYRSEAFLEQAMNLWGSTVYRLAFAQTASQSDAEDIYQEVFLRLLKDKTPFSNPEHLKAWLLRVTINCCHDLARSGWKRRTTPLENRKDEACEDNTDSSGLKQEFAVALREIPENQRAVVHLYYYEGYSTKEIAQILNIESSTVRSRMQRARASLREQLGGITYDEYGRVQRCNGLN